MIAWLLLTLAAGPAAGWVVGDLSRRPVDPGLDPKPLLGAGAGVEGAVGLVLMATSVAAIVTLAILARRGQLPAGWGLLCAGTGGLAAVTGAAYRVWAARVVGANFGGGMLVMIFPAVVALAVLLIVGATRTVRGCSWLAAAGWVSCSAILVIALLGIGARAIGQLDGVGGAGFHLVLLAYSLPALAFVPQAEQSAFWAVLLAGAAQWSLVSLACAGLLAGLDRPEPPPERI